MNKDNKLHDNSNIRNAFLWETVIGISANTVLLLCHVLFLFQEPTPKPTDLTTGLLALIHTLMLLTRAFIAEDILGSQRFGDDIACKSAIYAYRLWRSLSVCTTCLLSVSQAIILSPRSSWLAKFKHKSPRRSLCCFLLLWVSNMFLNVLFIIFIAGTTNETSADLLISKSCSISPMDHVSRHLFSVIGMSRDVSFIGLMALSSGYMVALLYRHKRRSQHLHCSSRSPKASPGQRATWTILLQVTFFLLMYFLDSSISSSRLMWRNDWIHYSIHMLIANGYATISPLVFISTEKRITTTLRSVWQRTVNVRLSCHS